MALRTLTSLVKSFPSATPSAAFAAVQAGQADLAYTAASYSDLTVDGYDLLAFKTVDNRGFNLPAVPSGAVTADAIFSFCPSSFF